MHCELSAGHPKYTATLRGEPDRQQVFAGWVNACVTITRLWKRKEGRWTNGRMSEIYFPTIMHLFINLAGSTTGLKTHSYHRIRETLGYCVSGQCVE